MVTSPLNGPLGSNNNGSAQEWGAWNEAFQSLGPRGGSSQEKKREKKVWRRGHIGGEKWGGIDISDSRVEAGSFLKKKT